MSMKKRKHPPSFKATVGLEAIKEQQTISQLASRFDLHPTQVRRYRDHVRSHVSDLFKDDVSKQLASKDQLIDRLYRQVGSLTMEMDWLKKKLGVNDD